MNLLTDSLITIADNNGNSRNCSLPDIYELAASDAMSDLPRIRPHQIPAFHAFLVQLGCIACEATELSSPPESASEWQRLLRSLTAAWPDDEPWQLVVADRAQPAFLQPAQPEDAPPLKTIVEQPDKLDLLVTSKNHDLKQRRMGSGSAEDWFFALLSVQTQEGFLGQGNYGIARMNGGFANRSFLTVAREQAGFGGRVFRDIHTLLSNLEAYYKTTIVRSGHTPRLVRFRRSYVLRRDRSATTSKVRKVAGPDVVFRGELEIMDGDAFVALVVRGIGRHRAFGFGCLLLAPPGALR